VGRPYRARNTTDWRFALNVDLARTISAATGLGLQTDGLDLLGRIKRSGFPLEGGPWIPGSSPPEHPAYCGYRTHRWMFVQYASRDRELYDYRHDPHELTNVAHRPGNADVMRRLRLKTMRTCRAPPPTFAW
jgi:hypothetical protein